jgi:hypothetical protein
MSYSRGTSGWWSAQVVEHLQCEQLTAHTTKTQIKQKIQAKNVFSKSKPVC